MPYKRRPPKMTMRQKRMAAFIQKFVEENGRSPTYREIGEGCEISSLSVVSYNLGRLAKMGHLKRLETKRGSHYVLKDTVQIPRWRYKELIAAEEAVLANRWRIDAEGEQEQGLVMSHCE
jgi:SOS-response transcriptional repressor LexA